MLQILGLLHEQRMKQLDEPSRRGMLLGLQAVSCWSTSLPDAQDRDVPACRFVVVLLAEALPPLIEHDLTSQLAHPVI